MKSNRRLISIILAMLLAFGVMPAAGGFEVSAESSGAEDVYSLLDPLTIEPGEQILPVTIDPDEGTAVVDGSGETETIEEVYALRPEKSLLRSSRKAALTGKDEILDFLLEKPCIVHEQEDGTLRAAYPFGIKILFALVEEGALEDTFGAVNAVYDQEWGRYILQYASQEDTAYAFEQLTELYGAENVLIDLPAAPSDDLKYDETEGNQTFSHFTKSSKSLSWGNDVMYMDALRDWANANPSGNEMITAVIDSGLRVDESSEQIIDGYGIDADRVITGYNTSISNDFYDYTALHDYSASGWQPKHCSYADLNGHGTHVMSTILDGTPDEVRVFSIRNSCYKPNTYNSSYYSTGDIDGMVKSVELAGQRGAKVVNISQGIRCYDYETNTYKGYYGKGILKMENISYMTFVTYNKYLSKVISDYDLCVVGSAGNDGRDMEENQQFPPTNDSVIAVSNIRWPGSSPELYSSSNFGDNISFCAPGATIIGAGYDWDLHKACYVSKTGTSMSAPHITAALSTIRLYYPQLSNTEAVDLLSEVCMDLGDTGRDELYGYGVPQFKANVDLTFVYNDGDTANQVVTIPKTLRVNEPAPSRYGYTFGGWYTDEECTKKFDFSEPVRKSARLYAKWDRIYKMVILRMNGQGGADGYIKVPLGECADKPADPADPDWKFCGWFYDEDGTYAYDFNYPVTSNFNLYAKWEPKKSNPLSVKAKTAAVKYSKLKKKSQSLAVTKVIRFVKKGQGKMSYSLVSAKKGSKSYKKYFKVSSGSGKVTIKKGLKKGRYKVKVKLKAAGNNSYKASKTKTVTYTIRIK